MMSEFHFLYPWWFLLLLPLATILWRMWRYNDQKTAWGKICDPHLLSYLLISTGTSKKISLLAALTIVWVITTIALAGPTWSRIEVPVYRAQAAAVIAVDLSPAMYATDIQPDRMTRAKFKVRDILQRRQQGQIGMVAFSGEAYVVSPLTNDNATIIAMLPQLNPDLMPVAGSDISAALQQSAQLMQQVDYSDGQIVLMTANHVNDDDIRTARYLHQQGFSISVIGIATEQGAPIPTDTGFVHDSDGNVVISQLDQSGLRDLARAGGGYYSAFSTNNNDINQILKNDQFDYSADEDQVQFQQWQDRGRYFILILLPFALLVFRKGWYEKIT